MEKSKEWEEGKQAKKDGATEWDNPYWAADQRSVDWENGFNFRKKKK